MQLDRKKYIEIANTVLETEAQAILAMKSRIDDNFLSVLEMLMKCAGRIVVSGIGKSGHIANKIASTMASTGSPAFYMHPVEASHGDFGMLSHDDIIILLSNSGETEEINHLLPALKRMNIPTIAITSSANSTLGKAVNICLCTGIEEEACPLGLAPTASTAATLAVGDTLAILLSQMKSFTSEDFARLHPGGKLGRRLLLLIEDIMHTDESIPKVSPTTPLAKALYEMSAKRLGMTLVVENNHHVVGIFTDGDLRRTLDKNIDIHKTAINSVMTRDFYTIRADALAIDAMKLMEKHAINCLPVLDNDNKLVGTLNIHDLLRTGI